MPRPAGPWGIIGWLRVHGTKSDLAGAAFLIGSDIVLTCAHVVRDHLGLATPTPPECPTDKISVRFEAVRRELLGRVMPNGWFADSAEGVDGLSDIAVIRLEDRLHDVTIPAIARTIPNQQFDALMLGAEPGYERIGQQVQVKISGMSNFPGWRKLDSAPTGFSVKRGFSGAPAMDELGNTVWGMIATVDAAGERVAFAITADDLRSALRLAGAVSTTGVRIEDDADVDARQAMIALREQVTGMEVEFQQKQQEIAHLQEMVRSFEQRERSTPGTGPERRALQSLAEGDTRPATEILRERIRQQRAEAAAASRQLGSLLSLASSADALDAYREAATLDPNDFWTLIEVGDRERQAGSLFRAAAAYSQAHEIAVRLAEADPHNTDWQRDLSVSHNRIGDVRRAQGDLPGALDAFNKGLEIAVRLAQTDPHNTEWERDLSVIYDRIGDVRRAQGDLPGALDAYNKGLEIRVRLAQADPHNTDWQRDLSVSHDRVGDVRRAQGDLPGALDAYRKSLEIRTRLAERDPSNAQWQQDLTLVRQRIAELEKTG